MTFVERLAQNLLKNDNTGAALVMSGHNRRYLTGFPSSAGLVLVTTEASYLLMDFRYAEAASYAVKDCQVVEFSNMYEKLGELLKKHNYKTKHSDCEITVLNISDYDLKLS